MHDLFSAYVDETGRLVMDQADPKTGELVPVPIGELPTERALVGLGYAIRNVQMSTDQQLAILDEQIGFLQMHRQRVTERSDNQSRFLQERAAMLLNILKEEGKVPLDKQLRPAMTIPGCGKWAILTTQRASLDRSDYDAMSEDQRTEIALAHKDLFRIVKVLTIKPDARAILKQLQAGQAIDGFAVNPSVDGITFKPETGTGLPPVGTKTISQDGEE